MSNQILITDPAPKNFQAYKTLIAPELYAEIIDLATKLKGAKIGILNSTQTGGGVAEILNGFVPILRSLGLDATWYVMPGDESFFEVTKGFHNALQGQAYQLSESAKSTYLANNEQVSKGLKQYQADVWEIHDPQPAAVAQMASLHNSLWRCHIDTSNANPAVWGFLNPYISYYDELIFTLPQFIPTGVDAAKSHFVAPTIDPLATKNLPINETEVQSTLKAMYIDPNQPLIVQVSRFDRWKDPMGVIEAYCLAKKSIPTLQLALVGSMATDDPEGKMIFKEVKTAAAGDHDVHIFVDLSEKQVSALQTGAGAVIQKSIKEGFGLTVAEGMWHRRPVIGGNTGGIKLQIRNGENGYLVDSAEDCAARVVELIKDKQKADEMGKFGHNFVREHFLLPRLVRDHLKLYHKMLKI